MLGILYHVALVWSREAKDLACIDCRFCVTQKGNFKYKCTKHGLNLQSGAAYPCYAFEVKEGCKDE